MFYVNCLVCGVLVELKFVVVVMVVCSFCKSMFLCDGEMFFDIGKMFVVLEDYVCVQIGIIGCYKNKVFIVVGCIQLCYDVGFWNEWYVLFDDGNDGWLVEVFGQVMMMFVCGMFVNVVVFEVLCLGQLYDVDGKQYVLFDVCEVDCIGGQGELLFCVGEGWYVCVVDGCREDVFIMLDYFDGMVLMFYVGEVIMFDVFKCQFLCIDVEIKEIVGCVLGKFMNFDCLQCGMLILFSFGVMGYVLCFGCGVVIDVVMLCGDIIVCVWLVLQVVIILELGDKVFIDGLQWQVIGVMCCVVVDGGGEWFEYLLYMFKCGFSWMVEIDDGWFCVSVFDCWFIQKDGCIVVFDGKVFICDEDYILCVIYVVGVFNWCV